MNLSIILLGGGKGKRLGSPIPKVFLPLHGKPIILHSFEVFQSLPYVNEIVVVCEEKYRHIFPKNTLFAYSGKDRQDSAYNGFKKTSGETILIHDGARPFITKKDIDTLLEKGLSSAAATLGIPLHDTIKQVNTNNIIENTLDRSKLYAIQTPQLLKREILHQGFQVAKKHNLKLTDDVSLAELIHHRVKVIPGSYKNIKITTPQDLQLAAIL